MNTKKAPLFALVVIIALLLTSCGGSPAAVKLSPRLQAIKDSGQLVIGTALTAPFEFRNAQTGELQGLDVELAKAVAAQIGVPVVWKEMAFADLIPTLQEGKVDMVIAGMYITDARKELVDMSQGYVDTGLIAVGRAGETAIGGENDMAGKVVCVKTGSTGAKYSQSLIDKGIALTIQEYSDTPSSLDDLSKGFCDLVMNDKINSIEYIKNHPDLQLSGDVLQPAQIGAAVKKGDTELLDLINTTFQAMKDDGRLEKLYNTWVLGQ